MIKLRKMEKKEVTKITKEKAESLLKLLSSKDKASIEMALTLLDDYSAISKEIYPALLFVQSKRNLSEQGFDILKYKNLTENIKMLGSKYAIKETTLTCVLQYMASNSKTDDETSIVNTIVSGEISNILSSLGIVFASMIEINAKLK